MRACHPPPTGLAGQKIIALNTHSLMDQFKYSDVDLMTYLLNVECLEAAFDTYGAFGQNMHPALFAGGPTPIGGRKANLSEQIQPWVEEVARAEVGHVRLLREALGAAAQPCPLIDIDKAFEQFFNMAFGRTGTNW